ncbi:hypothetical protein DL93DRAFT_843047 [Clavulina sp. PMI_390]|nr:hypothetical protein DL93DRAFT_843047 [Clavulina sp. PMI_390]
MAEILEDLASCRELDLTSSAQILPSLKRSYSQSDRLAIRSGSSNVYSVAGTDNTTWPSRSQQLQATPSSSHSPTSSHPLTGHTSLPLAQPSASNEPASSMEVPPVSPITHFLQSFGANIASGPLITNSNGFYQGSDPATFNNAGTGVVEEGITATSFPLSINPPPPRTLDDWDNFLTLGAQSRTSDSDSLRSTPLVASDSFQSTGAPGPLLLSDSYLGYEGFGGSLGFAAEAQAFLGGDLGRFPLDGAEDIDWSNLLNLG